MDSTSDGKAGRDVFPDAFRHEPVLLSETLAYLAPRPGAVIVDATVGGGGHAAEIARRLAPNGLLFGIDQDGVALAAAARRLLGGRAPDADMWSVDGSDSLEGETELGVRVHLVRGNFRSLVDILRERGVGPVAGVLFDLGVSSPQLDVAERGFSYWADAPLDMRMDRKSPLTAAEILNTWPEERIADILWNYGEERWSRRIARFIVQRRAERPLRTTLELVELIKEAVPAAARREGPHPARRTFQALRIAVNDELGALKEGLSQALQVLVPGGRLVAISFHSLEDRLVKQFFRDHEARCVCPPNLPVCVCGRPGDLEVLTRRPIVAGPEEIEANPRARSARLRAARRRQGQPEEP